MFNIRAASTKDLNALNQLSCSLGYEKVSDKIANERLQYLLSSGTDRVWVIEKDKALLGWIHVFIAQRVASAAFCEIGGLVIAPNSRRMGLGRQLVNEAKQWAASQNMPLRVRCKREREATQLFYASLGLSVIKQQNIFEYRS